MLRAPWRTPLPPHQDAWHVRAAPVGALGVEPSTLPEKGEIFAPLQRLLEEKEGRCWTVQDGRIPGGPPVYGGPPSPPPSDDLTSLL